MYETNTAREKEEVRCVMTLFWRGLVVFAWRTIYAWEVEYNFEVPLCYLKIDATDADARVLTVKLLIQRHHTGSASFFAHLAHVLVCHSAHTVPEIGSWEPPRDFH